MKARVHGRDDAAAQERRVRVVGILDAIRDGRGDGELVIELDGGGQVPVVPLRDDASALTELLGERVLVQGRAVYGPAGRVLHIDADVISSGEHEPLAWSQIPPPPGRSLEPGSLRQPQGPSTGAAAVFGKWPGDESEEELLSALKSMG